MGLFTKKDNAAAQPAQPGAQPAAQPMPGAAPQQVDLSQTPTALVIQMRQQGLDNNQIVQSLQREGFKSQQIFDAMNQADTKAGVDVATQQNLEQQPPSETPVQPSAAQPGAAPAAMGGSKEEIEEIVESVVEEKMEDMVKENKKISDWKDKTEDRISKIEQQLIDMKTNFDNLHKGVLGKIEEYDKGINDVGTEIKALEKVFQKILPTLTENVSELSRITQGMKAKTSKKEKEE